jgi:hypothetical protein
MSGIPSPVRLRPPSQDYVWIDLGLLQMEVRQWNSIDGAYANAQAEQVVGRIAAGIEASMDWQHIDQNDAHEIETGREIRDLVWAVKMAKRIGRNWNAIFDDDVEIAPFDEEHIRRVFLSFPLVFRAFLVQVFTMTGTIEVIEGNGFAVAPNGDTDTAAKPADFASSKETAAPLVAETASQASDAPKKRTRRNPK